MESTTNGTTLDPNLYNADELVPPKWINGEFFESVLKTAKKGDIKKILNFNITPASAKGDHYASIMFRTIVQYLDKSDIQQEISLIVKTMPEEEGTKKDFLSDAPIFQVEIQMFDEILPKFEEMLRSVGDNTILSAKMLYHTLNPRKVIVLEDITKKGFSAIGKRMCTIEEAKMALEKLAKWHACSYVLNEETNGSLEKLTNGIYNMSGLKTDWFTKGVERVAQLAHETPKLHKYAEKLDQVKHLIMPKCYKTYEISKDKININVLTHGDFHAKNLMFKINPKTQLSEEVMLIDFQLSVWCSMVTDLLYFIYLTIELESREKYFEELIYYFFSIFRDTLKLLNYKGKIPTFSDLHTDMLTLCHVEIYLATTLLPFMVSLLENPQKEPNDILSYVDKQYECYQSQMYIDQIQPILERLLNRGYFDNVIDYKDEE
ncbi:uncharacterized protein LOC129609040 [Condylostylus longicornis]|uniref:uncharacterized protein LOC129609040 n=1 Tax=Condylostylus longicornis TaxID=2530218 RepID=UPI00244E50ED|nr:uncharacterized protein LOC129609040 [Condylostylus longicornis]